MINMLTDHNSIKKGVMHQAFYKHLKGAML